MADWRWSDIYAVLPKTLCSSNFCVWQATKLEFTNLLQMVSMSLCPQFETNLMSNRKAIELFLQLKSAKAHGKNYIKSDNTWSAIFCVIVVISLTPSNRYAWNIILCFESLQKQRPVHHAILLKVPINDYAKNGRPGEA